MAKDTYEKTIVDKIEGATELSYQVSYKTLYDAVNAAYALVGKLGQDVPSYETLISNSIVGKTIKPSATNDGGDVPASMAWVSTAVYNNYLNAIQTASDMLKNPTAVTATLDRALTTLNTATDTITRSAKLGMDNIKAAKELMLDNAIASANNLINFGIATFTPGSDTSKGPLAESNNGADISATRNWTTTALYTNLNTALVNAKNAKNNISTTTLASLDTVTANLNKALTAIGTPKSGTLTKGSDSEEASIARSDLKILINEALALSKFKTSANNGTDVPEGTDWVTTETVDEFETYEGSSASAAPTRFILNAYNEALVAHNKKYAADPDTGQSLEAVSEAAYDLAKKVLQHAIDQFTNIRNNLTPIDGTSWTDSDSVAMSGGSGSSNAIKEARTVLKERIDLITDVVKNTLESSDGDNVPDGRYYAGSSDIDTIETALANATLAWRDTKKSEKELTYGSEDGDTVASDQIPAGDPDVGKPFSALGILNGAYEIFAGVDDNHSGSGTVGVGAEKRKLKGSPDPVTAHESSPLGLASQAVINLSHSPPQIYSHLLSHGQPLQSSPHTLRIRIPHYTLHNTLLHNSLLNTLIRSLFHILLVRI
ncbi:hypothetical protein AN643_01935 [Candidatus Epulonipiscioides saccharophilum]|nr:hypothetical protein AN643_01935 [Epulopiscium sp. SCG-B10WGA-EpuloB]